MAEAFGARESEMQSGRESRDDFLLSVLGGR